MLIDANTKTLPHQEWWKINRDDMDSRWMHLRFKPKAHADHCSASMMGGDSTIDSISRSQTKPEEVS